MSPSPSSASPLTALTKLWNSLLRATKSVSELTSITAPTESRVATPTRPSAATRPALLAAADKPFILSQSTAASISPPLSPSALLQSIMPAPVLSRSSLTSAAVISAIVSFLCSAPARVSIRRQPPQRGARPPFGFNSGVRRRRFARRQPAIRLWHDGGVGIVSHAEFLGPVVGQIVDGKLGARADVNTRCGEFGLQPVEHCTRHEVAIEMDCPHRVVVPGNRIGDSFG